MRELTGTAALVKTGQGGQWKLRAIFDILELPIKHAAGRCAKIALMAAAFSMAVSAVTNISAFATSPSDLDPGMRSKADTGEAEAARIEGMHLSGKKLRKIVRAIMAMPKVPQASQTIAYSDELAMLSRKYGIKLEDLSPTIEQKKFEPRHYHYPVIFKNDSTDMTIEFDYRKVLLYQAITGGDTGFDGISVFSGWINDNYKTLHIRNVCRDNSEFLASALASMGLDAKVVFFGPLFNKTPRRTPNAHTFVLLKDSGSVFDPNGASYQSFEDYISSVEFARGVDILASGQEGVTRIGFFSPVPEIEWKEKGYAKIARESKEQAGRTPDLNKAILEIPILYIQWPYTSAK